jgi:hypothetical protein
MGGMGRGGKIGRVLECMRLELLACIRRGMETKEWGCGRRVLFP